jgi:glycosyltransferase involved in cell wall biosynthesis
VSATRFRLATIDLARPLPSIALDEGENGVGLTIRLDGRPIGFVLRDLPQGTTLEPAAVARLLGHAERLALLEERIRRELLDWEAAGPERLAGTAIGALPRPVPSLTAVVCSHDRPRLLERCLESLVTLRARAASTGAALEILVVDNAPSDDRTRDVAARAPGVRYVREPLVGLDFARNRGLEAASGDFVAYFDDDVVVDPAWLEGFVEAWSAHPDCAAITGPVLPLELVTPAQIEFERLGGFGHRFRRIRFGPTLATNDVYPCGPGIFGAGCNMAFRRDALRRLGGFDEALDTGAPLPGGGDLDVFYRLVRARHVLVSEPRCLVLHQHRREYGQLRHQLWTWGLGFMAFVGKSYVADPSQRAKFRRLLVWWLGRGARMLVQRARGDDAPPVGLVLAELAGGVIGLCGEYGRSRRRVARLRRASVLGGALVRGGAG